MNEWGIPLTQEAAHQDGSLRPQAPLGNLGKGLQCAAGLNPHVNFAATLACLYLLRETFLPSALA